ncbi:Hypothetical predicted protein, partial [Prunus dulcis]
YITVIGLNCSPNNLIRFTLGLHGGFFVIGGLTKNSSKFSCACLSIFGMGRI